MNNLNLLLKKQLDYYGVSRLSEALDEGIWLKLLEDIDRTYTKIENERQANKNLLKIYSDRIKKLEIKLAHEREKTQSVMTEGFCVINENCMVTSINSAGIKLLQCEENVINNKYFNDIFSLHDINPNTKSDHRLDISLFIPGLSKGQVYSFEKIDLIRSKGMHLPISLSINPLPLTKDNEFSGAVILFKDISKQVSVEKALQQAVSEAKKSNEIKSLFVANMSHEIRTPMHGVLSMIELLLKTDLCKKQKRFALMGQESAKILLRVINDILDFSKLDAKKLEFENIRFNLKNEVNLSIAILSEKIKNKKIIICENYSDTLPEFVYGDPARISQIITNIVGNAVKFTNELGKISIDVDANKQEGDEVIVNFIVSDNGIGMSELEQQKIFDSFTQVDSATTRKFGGTGLGLAICKQIVEQMGGHICVHSTEGEGSTFEFSVVLKSSSTALCLQELSFKNKKIFIITNCNTSKSILQTEMKSCDIEHEVVCDLDSAITQLKTSVMTNNPYALIILDSNLSDDAGIEWTRLCAFDANLATTPILILGDIDEFNSDAYSKNVCGLISKPINSATLKNHLVNHLCPYAHKKNIAEEQFIESTIPQFNANVLLVEDNPVNQIVTCSMLDIFGCDVDMVCNGKHALDNISEKCYDLIFMDCLMPVLDGFQTTKKIRRKELCWYEKGQTNKKTPIVALTANALPQDKGRCLDAGMNDYVSKPFSMRQLEAMLCQYLPHCKVEGRTQDDVATETNEDEFIQPVDLSEPFLDQARIESLLYHKISDTSTLFEQALNVYLDDAPRLIAELRNSVLDNKYILAKGYAQKLKASSMNIGALRMSNLCKQAELLCYSDPIELDSLLMSLQYIEHAYNSTRIAILQELAAYKKNT